MSKQKMVRVTGPDGAEGEVLPESTKVWEKHGWTVVDDESSEVGVSSEVQASDQAKVTNTAKPRSEAVQPPQQ